MLEVFSTEIPPSKSLLNRALILQSFDPELKIKTLSSDEGEDTKLLRSALEDFQNGKTEFYIGAGAAPLKFLAIRLSRVAGVFAIRGTPRLFSRPLKELVTLLQTLGCEELHIDEDSLSFRSTGKWPEALSVSGSASSQLLSALLLASWELEHEVLIRLNSESLASLSYLEMTMALMQGAGWSGEVKKNDTHLESILLPKKQFLVLDEFFVEPDMSCIAAVALAGVLKDDLRVRGVLPSSLQGDQVIFSILKEMGMEPEFKVDKEAALLDSYSELPQVLEFNLKKQKPQKGIKVDLFSTPDLFPVLAAFCVSAESESELSGLANLNSKESKRLDKVSELFSQLQIPFEASSDTFRISPFSNWSESVLDFDPDQDHRLAMAAEILRLQGAKIRILNHDVVNKSFPNFWKLLDLASV